MIKPLLAKVLPWVIQIVATIFFMNIAFNMSSLAVSRIREEKAAHSWPKTDATIIAMKLEETIGRHRMWQPVYTYQYTVNGKQYSNNRLSIGAGIAFQYIQDARLNIAKHPIGSTLRVRYNPAAPEESTVNISFDNGSSDYMAILISLIAFVFPGYIYFLLFINDKQTT